MPLCTCVPSFMSLQLIVVAKSRELFERGLTFATFGFPVQSLKLFSPQREKWWEFVSPLTDSKNYVAGLNPEHLFEGVRSAFC